MAERERGFSALRASQRPLSTLGVAVTAALLGSAAHADIYTDLGGSLTVEGRFFSEDAPYAGQSNANVTSMSFAPDLYLEWGDGAHSLSVTPFLRVDSVDEARTHNDLREFLYLYAGENHEFRAGVGEVFWGVTEFQNPVDVINQSDSVEDLSGSPKLGQPMVSLTFLPEWGAVDVLLLPGFRERTYPGVAGRLRAGLPVDTAAATFESDDENNHIDYALRWSQTLGDFDVGAHAFSGTNRSPTLTPVTDGGVPVALAPFYAQMDQVGLDLQATLGSWLWKAEWVNREQQGERFDLAQAGVEYSFYSQADGLFDLGVLVELGWDERGVDAADNILQNDLGAGLRFAFNDEASSEMLIGVIEDQDFGSRTVQLEASRRLGDSWRVSLDIRSIDASDAADPLAAFDADDHAQITLERFF